MTARDRTGNWKNDEGRPKPCLPNEPRMVRDGGGGSAGAVLCIPVVIFLLYLAGAFG